MLPRNLSLLATAAALFLNSGVGLAAAAIEAQLPDEIVVEQADILVSASPDDPSLEGYLVIWNGTGQSTSITDVRSSAFEKVRFIQTVRTETETQGVVQKNLSIPAHSELLMRPGGVFLSIDPGKTRPRVGEQVDLEIVYADGTSDEVAAKIESNVAALKDHHHGMQ